MSDEELSFVEVVDPVAVAEITDAPEVSEPEGKRGRPRDPQAVERDNRVAEALAAGPLTREQLATNLNLEGKLVYLSLWRLRNAGNVALVNGEGAKRAWQLVTADVTATTD